MFMSKMAVVLTFGGSLALLIILTKGEVFWLVMWLVLVALALLAAYAVADMICEIFYGNTK